MNHNGIMNLICNIHSRVWFIEGTIRGRCNEITSGNVERKLDFSMNHHLVFYAQQPKSLMLASIIYKI